jgi:hypothetical protein
LCRAFAENLFEQLHGAKAEAVQNCDEVLQTRRSISFPYYGWHKALPLIPFRLNHPSHLESLVFHLNCLPPLQILSILFPYPPPKFPLPSDNVNAASSFPRYRLPPLLESTCSMLGEPKGVVLDFRFPVRMNARVSVGLREKKLRFKKVGLRTQPLLHAICT